MKDTRVSNRLREHTQQGHTLTDTGKTSIKQLGCTLFKCSCSWSGWLPTAAVREYKEKQLQLYSIGKILGSKVY